MNSVTAIIDSRAPQEAIENLKKHCNVFLFNSKDITYEAISCHPDIFLFQGEDKLIIAPNTPQDCIDFLSKNKISYTFGESTIGKSLKNSTSFNCLQTATHLFHKQEFTDKVISQSSTKKFIPIPQAYTRCSLIALNKNSFITSDKGIEKVLITQGFECFTCDPSNIELPPYKHGFIGGCMGIWNNKLFIIGNLANINNGNNLRKFIENQKITIIELYNGNLYDGGGIFFV